MLKKIQIGEHLTAILTEMCKRVEVELDKVDILANEWQEKYLWSIEEEKDFQEWMFQYLVKHKDALTELSTYRPNETVSAQDLMNLTREFTLFYGWALNEERPYELIKENNPKKK
jgi:hypothetical protein